MASGLQSATFITADPTGLPVSASIVQGAYYPGDGSGIAETFTSDLRLSIDLTQIADLEHLRIHLTSAESTGAGFSVLVFQIYKEGALIENDMFKDLTAAMAFFTNHDSGFRTR